MEYIEEVQGALTPCTNVRIYLIRLAISNMLIIKVIMVSIVQSSIIIFFISPPFLYLLIFPLSFLKESKMGSIGKEV